MTLHIQGVSHAFDHVQVLKHIDFTVEPGEFVSLIGPSGSGKSTLFNLIGGLIQPQSGQILIDGKHMTGQTGHISYMPQTPSLFPWRTVLSNALLSQELHGTPDPDLALTMLDKVGLRHVSDAYPHELSGGMQQRVAFIRALLAPQNMMCLDEPFSALDDFTRLDMQMWLLDIWETYSKSILFITHDLDEALLLSDKLVILSDSPAVVKDVIPVHFDRPREADLRLSDPFITLKKKVLNVMQAPHPSSLSNQ